MAEPAAAPVQCLPNLDLERRAWAAAPQADLMAVDEHALSDERVMDAARYLGGTNTYWTRAVTLATTDGLPERVSVRAPRGAVAPFTALRIDVPPEEFDED